MPAFVLVWNPDLVHFFLDLVGEAEVPLTKGAVAPVERIGKAELVAAEPAPPVLEPSWDATAEGASGLVAGIGKAELEAAEPASFMPEASGEGAVKEPAVWIICERDRVQSSIF